MQYYRCRCGKREAWGSMGPAACSGCKDCGTTLDMTPELHRTPEPHDFEAHPVETDQGGATLSRCRHCHRKKAQLEREAAADEGQGA